MRGMSYETWHWRILNVLARMFGIMALCAGLAFGASSLSSVRDPDARESVLTLSGNLALDFGLASAFLFTVGVLFIKAPAYRPDVAKQGTARSRSWWTGEPE